MQDDGWEKALEEARKKLTEQIDIFEKVAKANANNAWATVYAPLRNLFTIAKDHMDCLDQIRTETLELRKKNQALEARIKALEERMKS